MGATDKDIYDVSFAGATVVVGGRTITEFVDDANPVDSPDVTISNVGYSLGGKMYRTAHLAPILLSITVIPGSSDDNFLWKEMVKLRPNEGDTSEYAKPGTATITTHGANKESFSFKKGTIVSGPLGPSVSGDGKMKGRTYTFAFSLVG